MNESKVNQSCTKVVPPKLDECNVALRWHGTILMLGLLVIVLVSCATPTASYTRSDDEWNVMVVPSQQAVFSQSARELFNKNCASCHSKDGRAQTPIARQRHVQDLSECRLEDSAIVEQILNGTHNKDNTFKMPSFKDKLSRAEVESLVPLVKSFRSARPAPASASTEAGQSDHPRLVGIVNVGSFEYAVFERVRGSGQYFLLRKNESHDGVELVRIKHKLRTVVATLAGAGSEVELSLDGQGIPPKRTGITGWLKNLNDALAADPEGIVLKGASAELVLFLYSQLTGKTLLQSTNLSGELFDVESSISGSSLAALRIKQALRARGISITNDGPKFFVVMPETEVAAARQLSAELRSSAQGNEPPGLFPGGAIINLPDSDLREVVDLYAQMTGRSLDPGQPLSSLRAKVHFTTQTPLDTKECIHAFEMLLGLQGLKVVPAGGNAIRIALLSENAAP